MNGTRRHLNRSYGTTEKPRESVAFVLAGMTVPGPTASRRSASAELNYLMNKIKRIVKIMRTACIRRLRRIFGHESECPRVIHARASSKLLVCLRWGVH